MASFYKWHYLDTQIEVLNHYVPYQTNEFEGYKVSNRDYNPKLFPDSFSSSEVAKVYYLKSTKMVLYTGKLWDTNFESLFDFANRSKEVTPENLEKLGLHFFK